LEKTKRNENRNSDEPPGKCGPVFQRERFSIKVIIPPESLEAIEQATTTQKEKILQEMRENSEKAREQAERQFNESKEICSECLAKTQCDEPCRALLDLAFRASDEDRKPMIEAAKYVIRELGKQYQAERERQARAERHALRIVS